MKAQPAIKNHVSGTGLHDIQKRHRHLLIQKFILMNLWWHEFANNDLVTEQQQKLTTGRQLLLTEV